MDGGKISVNEPPPGIGQGVLSELWRSDKPLPRVRGLQLYAYFVQQGLRTITALPANNVIAIMTMAVSVFLFAGFLLTLQNIDRVISRAGTSLSASIYLRPDVSDTEAQQVVEQIREDRAIRSLDYISKAEALDLFGRELGAQSSFLQGLGDENPLPASVEITLYKDELGIDQVDATIERLRQYPQVDEVVFGSDWVDRVQGVIAVFRGFGVGLLLIVLSVIVFLIGNTIKLIIYARREEVEIMQLVGATDNFIRVPFVIGGMIQGLVGAALGLIIVYGAFVLVNFEVTNSELLGVVLPSLVFIHPMVVLSLLLVGSLIGGAGSHLALRRFLDV